MDGGFGDAVHVDELRGLIAVALEPGLEAREVESFAAEDDVAQGEHRGGGSGLVGLDELTEGGGGLIEDGDLLGAEEVMEGLG